MMRRLSLAFLALTLSLTTAAHSQRSQQGGSNSVEVVVNVAYDDNNEVPKMCRVQLLTSARMPVAEAFANDRGQANFRVSAGSYMVQVLSMEAETGEITFVVNPRESTHSEWVRLKRKPVNGTVPTSTDGSVSQ